MNKLQLCWPILYIIMSGPDVKIQHSKYEDRNKLPTNLYFKGEPMKNYSIRTNSALQRITALRLGEMIKW